jgi:hypothetical protein
MQFNPGAPLEARNSFLGSNVNVLARGPLRLFLFRRVNFRVYD